MSFNFLLQGTSSSVIYVDPDAHNRNYTIMHSMLPVASSSKVCIGLRFCHAVRNWPSLSHCRFCQLFFPRESYYQSCGSEKVQIDKPSLDTVILRRLLHQCSKPLNCMLCSKTTKLCPWITEANQIPFVIIKALNLAKWWKHGNRDL